MKRDRPWRRMEERAFTPEEANAVVPRLRPLLVALREVYHEYQFARSQWEELRALGFETDDEGKEWRAKADALGARVLGLLQEIRGLGADVKDPLLGLADFPVRRRDGSIALLCYRDDEERIGFWHTTDDGFAGRRPLVEL